MITAVVGAGPAGLLFTLIGKLMLGDAWTVHLYDKRESYVRECGDRQIRLDSVQPLCSL